MELWTIEVLDGAFSARQWQDAHGDALVEAAQGLGVVDWDWSRHSWGVVLELTFRDEASWLRYRALPAVRAALDAVPDGGAGLLIYPGRGGGAGSRVPRRPKRPPQADAAALPVPVEEPMHLVSARMEPSPFSPAGSA